MSAKWYIINALSGYEKKVLTLIKENAAKNNVTELFEDFVIPVENTVEVKKGKKVNAERKIFPGYILVKMELNDLTWNIVKNTQYVGKLLGGGNKPLFVPDHEVEMVLKQVEDGKIVKEIKRTFEIGENIKIISGVFETFNGIVEEVDDKKKRLKILVSIFGRETPVELEFEQVEKLTN
jgi:transcriptional antiterminator NusG